MGDCRIIGIGVLRMPAREVTFNAYSFMMILMPQVVLGVYRVQWLGLIVTPCKFGSVR